jgi:hypothetical protein
VRGGDGDVRSGYDGDAADEEVPGDERSERDGTYCTSDLTS